MSRRIETTVTRRLAVLGLALAIDLALGEPPALLHPVVWIGRLIGWMEHLTPQALRPFPLSTAVERGSGGEVAWVGLGKKKASTFAYGAVMAFAVPAVSAGVALAAERLAGRLHPALGILAAALMLKPAFAIRDLFAHVERVRVPLEAGDLPSARHHLQMIVSRDTSALSPALVAAAAVETVAENASDSVVAPLLSYALFGLPGVWWYRAANTLDAMIGYRGKYEYLGKASARLDDLLNLVPSRLCALLIAIASPLGLDRWSAREAAGSIGRSLETARRHHGATASPNAGWPMSAMAGAVGAQLEKEGHYKLGDPSREPVPGDVRRAERIAAGAIALAMAVCAGVIVVRGAGKERDRA
jgi:adenosylcobinamide-phosphate synthase